MGKKDKKQKEALNKSSVVEETQIQEEPAKKKKFKKPQIPKYLDKPNWTLTGLAAAGMILTAYLSLIHWFGQKPLLCNEGSTCSIVQGSRWGTFLLLPTAFWGFLTYTALAFIGFKIRNRASHWKAAWTVSLIGFAYSIYLVSISIFVIKATCIYCLASFSIMTIIFIVMTSQRSWLPNLNFASWARQAAIVAVIIIGGMHLHYSGIFYSGAGPEKPYLQGLVAHLVKEDAKMYGAFW
ncbi:MAG: vitamin K epoxide reductase family protein [Thermodesulfovibrionia bacterium]|nr:vitamin K epoxide reductase family protein [Thermodesulfovibrionia bacterium]